MNHTTYYISLFSVCSIESLSFHIRIARMWQKVLTYWQLAFVFYTLRSDIDAPGALLIGPPTPPDFIEERYHYHNHTTSPLPYDLTWHVHIYSLGFPRGPRPSGEIESVKTGSQRELLPSGFN